MKLSPEKRFIYAMTFSGDYQMKARIQEKYLKFIKEVEKLISECETSEQVYQINFDLFPWAIHQSEN